MLKAENLQRTGSFKIRGAMSKLAALAIRRRERRHRRQRRQPCPGHRLRRSSLRRAVRDLRAGRRADCRRSRRAGLRRDADRGRRLARRSGRCGAGSAPPQRAWCSATRTTTSTSSPARPRWARELVADVADLRRVIVPLGGGGLASGIAIAVKGNDPTVEVIGVQVAACAPYAHRRRSRRARSSRWPTGSR